VVLVAGFAASVIGLSILKGRAPTQDEEGTPDNPKILSAGLIVMTIGGLSMLLPTWGAIMTGAVFAAAGVAVGTAVGR